MTPVHITGGHTFHHISPGQILTSIEQGGMDRPLTIKHSQVEQIDALLHETSVSITLLFQIIPFLLLACFTYSINIVTDKKGI